MKKVNREDILRMVGRSSSGRTISSGGEGSGGGSGVSQFWVDENYVSKEFFNKLFEIHDENGDPILPNDVETEIDNIQAMFGFWTNAYLSALGNNPGGGGAELTLASLSDVAVQGVADGQALVWNATRQKWVPGQGGIDVTAMWAALAQSGTQQIDASHLGTALTGYATETWVGNQGYITSSALNGYATETWVGTQISDMATKTWVSGNYLSQTDAAATYVSIAFFERLFKAYNGSTVVHPNNTTSTIDNIKAMFGFWTDAYLSALGNNPGGGGAELTLASLADVAVQGVANGQALVWNATRQKWVPGQGGGIDVTAMWAALSQSGTQQIDASHLGTALTGYATETWVGNQGYITSSALNGYLPLTGGTLTSSNYPLVIKSTSANSWIYFQSTISGTVANRAAVGYYNNFAFISNEASYARIGVADDGTPQYWNNSAGGSGHVFDLIHSGNIGSQSVASASKLTTARTIWGQSFDGSGNVDGTLYVTGSSNWCEGIRINNASNGWTTIILGASGTSGTNANAWSFHTYQGNFYLNRNGSDGHTGYEICNVGGNWGISTTSPSYKLDVAGDVRATNFRGNLVGNADSATTAASCTGNAATATRLQTAHTIWGQNFDGTSNVSGAISGATTITASSNVSVGGTLGVTGSTTLSSTLSVSGNTTIGGSLKAQEVEITGNNEVNCNYGGGLHLQWSSSKNVTLCYGGGSVGIGRSDASYKLHVEGVIYSSTGVYSAGYVTALSDIRHKDVKGDVGLTVSEVANAPAVKFLWKDRRQDGLQVGSIAQYWQKVMPEAIVEAADGELTMSYGVIALLASIANAREIVNLKREISELKRKLQKHGTL